MYAAGRKDAVGNYREKRVSHSLTSLTTSRHTYIRYWKHLWRAVNPSPEVLLRPQEKDCMKILCYL
ncbi:hypothetical protein KKE26_05715 [bacterium]|nr:hypothetical protein [bacterium]